MRRILQIGSARLLRVVAALALALPAPGGAADCDVKFRLWQQGENTYYDHGEPLVLQRGEKADLYIHVKSRSRNPFSTSADIGAAADFRVGSQRQRDVNRVLKLRGHDARKGKVSLEAVAGGETALGYRITAVAKPGRLQDVARDCRTGQVRITVEDAQGIVDPPPSGSASAGEAAQQLITDLLIGILRQRPSEVDDDYPNEWFDWVQASGLDGLVEVAEILTASAEFHDAAIPRTRAALSREGISTHGLSRRQLEEHLLEDICESLYGNLVPNEYTLERLANTLGACLAGGQLGSCQRLGRDLLNQREYAEHNRRLLRHWRY